MKDLEEKRLDLIKVLIEVSSLLAVVITFLFQVLASEPYNIHQPIIVILGFGAFYSFFMMGAIFYYIFNLFKIKIANRLLTVYVSTGFSILFSLLIQISIGNFWVSVLFAVVSTVLLLLVFNVKPKRTKKKSNLLSSLNALLHKICI